MRAYTEEVRRTRGLELRMRVGLNAGEVVVRAIGNDLHMDYSAVGETTHLAARMEQLATPGSIRLTAATLRLVEGLVQVSALGPVPVKGLVEPVEVFELVGASSLRGACRRQPPGDSRPLWGGSRSWRRCTRPWHGRRRATARWSLWSGKRGWASRAWSTSASTPIAPRAGGSWRAPRCPTARRRPTSPSRTCSSATAMWTTATTRAPSGPRSPGRCSTLDETLQETLPALLSLLEALPDDSPFLTLDPPQRRQRTLDGLKRVLLRESQVQPLLLVFEDLHWIDTETQAVLDRLVESLPTARLLLLVNYRPEYQHGWGSKTYYTQLRLDPLPPASAEEFLHALLGDDPSLAPLKQLLIARTEGNPFFLEESVRTLVEIGVLVGERGAYRLAQAIPTCRCQPRCRPCWRRASTDSHPRKSASCRRLP